MGARTVDLGVETLPFLADHRVQGRMVLPGAVYVQLAFEAAAAEGGRARPMLEGMVFERPFFVPASGTRALETRLLPDEEGTERFTARGTDGVTYATARIRFAADGDRPPLPADRRDGGRTELAGADVYDRLERGGNAYGPALRAVERVWRGDGDAIAVLRVPATEPPLDDFVVHPAILDGAVHVLAAAADAAGRTLLLAGWEGLRVGAGSGARCRAQARLRPESCEDELVGDVSVLDESGRLVVELTGVRLRALPRPGRGRNGAGPDSERRPRIAVAATFTAEPLGDALTFWLETLGLPETVEFAPYGQAFQQLLDPGSLLSESSNSANVILVRPEDWLRRGEASATTPSATPRDSLIGERARFSVPGVGPIAHLNVYETEFLYEEIFVRESYVRHGIELGDGDCVVDVGANIGMFTLFVGRRWPRARVLAFEPSPAAFDALAVNASMYCPNARVFQHGLGDANGVAPFTSYAGATLVSGFDADEARDRALVRTVVENTLEERLPPGSARPGALAEELVRDRLSAETLTCELRTLSAVIRAQGLERIDLLKIDAEGLEAAVLRGIEDEHWGLVRQVAVEVHDGDRLGEVTRLLRRHGFDVTVDEEADLLRGTGLQTVFGRRRADASAGRLERTADDFAGAVEALRRRTAAPCIVCLCPPSADDERRRVSSGVEDRLARRLGALPGVVVIRPAELQETYPVADYADAPGEALGHVPYTTDFFAALGTLVVRRFVAAARPPFKVVVVDCDDTLWAGACAEDGPDGVSLDAGRRALQELLRRRHEAGMLVCLCSKNDEQDVLAVFEHRRDMPLRLEHVTARRLNWKDKSENLVSLADELGLGLESFVFLDDDPIQCAEVRASCPEVAVIELPADPREIAGFLEHLWPLDRPDGLTDEDRSRASRYREESRRRALREAAPTFESFLAGLGLEVEIGPCSPGDVARVAQLTSRTTQFTTTGIRRSEAELRELLASGALDCLVVRVADRFGDYGLVGAMLYHRGADRLTVDTFLLSCRALGRGVEHRMLARLGATAEAGGLEVVEAPCVDTRRNRPVRDFLESVAATGVRRDGAAVFTLPAAVAAGVVFRPPGRGRRADPPSEPAPVAGLRVPPSAYGRISHELRDVDAVVSAIAARQTTSRPRLDVPFTPPGDKLERELAGLWRRVLALDEVGVDDNFFDLGGTSVRALQAMAELAAAGADVSALTIFEWPTIRALARMLRDGSDRQERSASRQRRGERRRALHAARRPA